jgi:hypothetical protein
VLGVDEVDGDTDQDGNHENGGDDEGSDLGRAGVDLYESLLRQKILRPSFVSFLSFENLPNTVDMPKNLKTRHWGLCYDFLDIFAENIGEKIGVFGS